MNVICIFGTRPEAIKMAPVIKLMQESSQFDVSVILTGQHREMLTEVLDIFDIRPDLNLDVMSAQQSLSSLTSSILIGLDGILAERQPDWVLVHGDTTTTMAAALASFYQNVKVGHVEAGLRTGNLLSPWPEEANRTLVSRIASVHFAPTESARENLLAEGLPSDQIVVTGNTVVDALLWATESCLSVDEYITPIEERFSYLETGGRAILVTGHRRESLDSGIERVCRAVGTLSETLGVEVVFPVHPNPAVVETSNRVLGGNPRVHLVSPLDYLSFVWLMNRAHVIITDSGGVQEEAPALGTPVFVTREVTERPEAVAAGVVEMVGTDESTIVASVSRVFNDPHAYAEMASGGSPYGDGQAAGRILEYLSSSRKATQ